MRKKLQSLNGKRLKFIGVFERYGTKSNWHGFPETTILIKDIYLSTASKENIVADHLWFSMTKGFEKLGNLTCGDIICFEARTTTYTKGYVNYREGIDERRTDYRLSRPTKFTKMAKYDKSEIINASLFSEGVKK